MTEPEDHSSTRPISVAELLARNGSIGAPPVGGRRRRRRGDTDSVTVAELTGEIPIITDHTTPDAPRNGPRPRRRNAAERAGRTRCRAGAVERRGRRAPDAREPRSARRERRRRRLRNDAEDRRRRRGRLRGPPRAAGRGPRPRAFTAPHAPASRYAARASGPGRVAPRTTDPVDRRRRRRSTDATTSGRVHSAFEVPSVPALELRHVVRRPVRRRRPGPSRTAAGAGGHRPRGEDEGPATAAGRGRRSWVVVPARRVGGRRSASSPSPSAPACSSPSTSCGSGTTSSRWCCRCW